MSAKTQDAPVQDAPQDFDLDAWLDNARLPERSVIVFGRADLVGEIEALKARMEQLKSMYADDDRLVDPTADDARRLRDLTAQLHASALEFRLRALTRDEQDAARASAKKDANGELDGDDNLAGWLATSCVSPKGLTREKVHALRLKIGEGQYNSLVAAVVGATNDRRVDIPFSLAASVALSRKDS